MGHASFPLEMTPILVMREMHWNWDDLARCPASIYDDILLLMQREAIARKK